LEGARASGLIRGSAIAYRFFLLRSRKGASLKTMRPIALAAAALCAASAAMALPEGFLDPSNAALKVGRLQVKSRDEATVNFSVTNLTDKSLLAVAVTCTALIDDEPVETNSNPVGGIGPKATVYASINFFEVKGRKNAAVSCRVQWIRLDR
jgi:hypothetical protein